MYVPNYLIIRIIKVEGSLPLFFISYEHQNYSDAWIKRLLQWIFWMNRRIGHEIQRNDDYDDQRPLLAGHNKAFFFYILRYSDAI